MNIHTLLDESTILADLKVKNKTDLLNELIDLLESDVDHQQLEEIRKAVFEREQIMSTGVGKGLAIPHGKAKNIDKTLAGFALLNNPVDYESIDDEPVKMVFLLVGPDKKSSIHIKLLSRISRLMNSSEFRNKLLACKSPAEIHDTFRREELKYFNN
ncbi:MAG: PTS sugar transporter subunit IIA [Balneolaceae bacterium]